MPSPKSFVPQCPESHCSSLAGPKIYELTREEKVEIPESVLARMGRVNVIYKCGDCGLVWFQRRVLRKGFDPTPVGYFRNGEFIPELSGVTIRPENRTAYWDRTMKRGNRGRR